MDETVRVVFADEVCSFGVYRNVMIAYYREQANALRMRGFRATQRDLSKQRDPVGCIIVSDLSQKTRFDLTDETRKEIGEAITAYNDRDLSVAMVVEFEGMLGTALRTLLSGIVLMARPKYPMKLFSARDEGTRWMAERLRAHPTPPTQRELIDAIAQTARGLR